MTDTAAILPILSAYIDRRDQAGKSSPFYVAGNAQRMTIPAFNSMVNAYHMQVAEYLPRFNVEGQGIFIQHLEKNLKIMQTGMKASDTYITWYRIGETPEFRLPPMNLAQMEAMVELMKSRLSWMRIGTVSGN